jgi:hypothetical protein
VTIAGKQLVVSQTGGGQGCPFIVTNNSDDGPGSLRQAISDINFNPGSYSIGFTFQGTITLSSPLPQIRNRVTIDGTDDTGAPGIELNGANAGSFGDGLEIVADQCSIKGLVINRFPEYGIEIFSNNNSILNCYIGTNVSGTLAQANGFGGILLEGSNNIIGGTGPGARNIIAFNSGPGVEDRPSTGFLATGNSIRGNSIFSNIGLGIDLDPVGVTPNDPNPAGCPADTDGGANNLQNFPVITSSTNLGGNSIRIQGTLNSTASTAFNIDFYHNLPGDSASSGRTYLGSVPVTTNANCIATFDVTFNIAVPFGNKISATATRISTGDTSEFSATFTPTAVELISFTATGYDKGCLLEWQTGFEADNLGFNLYRDEGGRQTLVNSQLIAGSALRAGSSIRSGEAYACWDSSTSKSATYWLEDLDLSGRSTWHGPFYAKIVGGAPTPHSPATFLSKLTGNNEPVDSSKVVENTASIARATPEQEKAQINLTSQSAVKISVRREGWYRLSRQELVAAGLPQKLDPRFLQLFVEGHEIPIVVLTDELGKGDEFSFVEFYGQGLDTPSTDRRTYWLIQGDTPGKRIKQSKGEGLPELFQSFTQAVERRDRSLYFAALLNGEKENLFGAVITGQPVDQSLNLQHLAPGAQQPATVEIALQGVTRVPHRVLVQLNEVSLGEVLFGDKQNQSAKFFVPHSVLREGANIVRLMSENGAGDVSLVDSIRLSYQHTFVADGDLLKFKATGKTSITVGGFSSNRVRVFDITYPDTIEELIGKIEEGSDGFRVTVAPQAGGERLLLAVAETQARRPIGLSANQPSALHDKTNEADLLIITPGNFLSALTPLKQARQAEGYKTEVVDVEDVYDEFSFGNKSPQAVRDFLAYAKANWKVSPRFVILAGDASYDTKNYLELGDFDLVPTKLIDTAYLETATDDWFTDFNNDGLPDLALGRLPVRTVEEMTALITKVLRYREMRSLNSALLVSDRNEGYDFSRASNELKPLLPPTVRVEELRRGDTDPAKAKAQLFEAIKRGQKVINYIGHGSQNVWNGGLLTTGEARNLTNSDRLPLFVMMNCLNGYFQDPGSESLAEALLLAEEGGGILVWASSGMTYPQEQEGLNHALYQILFKNDQGLTIGEAIRRAKGATTDPDVRATWALFGDPTIRLR